MGRNKKEIRKGFEELNRYEKQRWAKEYNRTKSFDSVQTWKSEEKRKFETVVRRYGYNIDKLSIKIPHKTPLKNTT